MDRKKRIAWLLAALAVTLACVPVLPAVAPLPTQPVGAVDTMIAGTYAAARTGTALIRSYYTSTPMPPPTLTPSKTPTITPTPTATVIFKMTTPTNTPLPKKTSTKKTSSSGGGGGSGGGSGGGTTVTYTCRVIGVLPASGTILAPGTLFTATWRMRNTSPEYWDHNSVDYLFRNGSGLHLQEIYDLPVDVLVGDTVDLPVDMQAPAAPGTYTTYWILRVGSQYFCPLKLTIKVQ